MKLKKPITDTKELLEIAFPLISAITAAGATDEDIATAGAALTMLISEIERADGEDERIATPSSATARNDAGAFRAADCRPYDGNGERPHPSAAPTPSTCAGEAEGKRSVFPDIYEKPKGVTLTERLREYAEWAECNEWETPLMLKADLLTAVSVLENAYAEFPRLRAIGERLPGGET